VINTKIKGSDVVVVYLMLNKICDREPKQKKSL